MKITLKTIVTLLVLISISALAKADACTDLQSRAEQGLAQQGLDGASRSQLEMLLEIGRGGDVGVCQQATTGSLLTPLPTGRICEKSEKTV
jgi:hypothetical protein